MKRTIPLLIIMIFAMLAPCGASNEGMVQGSYANIRKEAKFTSSIVGRKMRGDRYEILFEDKNWRRVVFFDGLEGWIFKTLVERKTDTVGPQEEDDEKTDESEITAKEVEVEAKTVVEKTTAKKPDSPKPVEKAASATKPAKTVKQQAPKRQQEPARVVELSGTAEELYNKAIEQYEQRKYQQALETNREALKKAPQNAEILNNIGNCLFKMGRIKDALDSWKAALKITPRSGKISNNIGIAYYQLDQNKEAIEYYQKAVLFEPEFPDPYYNIASVYGFAGQFEDAITNYRKFLEFSPDPTMTKLAEERILYCETQVKRMKAQK